MLQHAIKQLNPYLDKQLIVSVSTGVDSMVLLDLLIKLKANIVVVHFNHQVRQASDTEAEYIKNYCLEYNLPYEYYPLKIGQENFQDEARKKRLALLESTAIKYNTTYILTAHHLNDLAETILMKLSRGSNLYGYSGFQFEMKKDSFIYIKPFINIPKETLYDYARTHNITYFEDISNTSDAYTRNRYRHHIVDALIKENPNFLEKSLQYSIQLYEAFSFIRSTSKNYLESNKQAIFLDSFLKLDIALKKDIIALLMESRHVPFNHKKIEAILHFLVTSGPNQSYPLTDALVLKRTYQKVIISPIKSLKPFKQQLHLDAFNVFENMGYVTFLTGSSNISNYEVILCYNNIDLPLWARHRLPGDVLDMPYGHKKLKDFYIDRKIPKDQRDKDIIITDNNNRILAVLGRYYNKADDLKDSIKLTYKRGIL